MKAFYENRKSIFSSNYGKNLNYPFHLHSQMECIYVTEGSMRLKLLDSEYLVTAGDFIILFPNIIHGYTRTDEGSTSINTIFDISLSGSFINKISKYHPTNPIIKKENIHRDVAYVLKSITEDTDNSCLDVITESYLQLLLARVMPYLELSKNSASHENSLTYKIAWYIGENYTKHITLDTLATELCVCKYHISHMFSKTFGMSFSDYLNSTRLKTATYLLDTTDKPIIDIWNDCGFESQRTFNRVFKQTYSLSPSQYRGKAKK